jgi:epsin
VATTPGGLGKPVATTFGGPAAKPSGDAFAGLLGGNFSAKKDGGTGSKLTMADMARQKASAGIWGAGNTGAAGAPKPAAPGQPQQKLGGGLDDLLG